MNIKKTYRQTCAPNEDSDLPALSRIFTGRIEIAKDAEFIHADNEVSSGWSESSFGPLVRGYVFLRQGSYHRVRVYVHVPSTL